MFEDKQLNENDVFIEYLQSCGEKGMYKTLNKSNFYDEWGRAFIKCGGTSEQLSWEDNRVRFLLHLAPEKRIAHGEQLRRG